MDLRSALRIVGTPLKFPGRCNSALVEKVRPHVTDDDAWLREAHRLHGGASIRPVDILRALAVVTRPRYEGSVYDSVGSDLVAALGPDGTALVLRAQ